MSALLVFPTRVGMDRESADTRLLLIGIPHTRGDGPYSVLSFDHFKVYSPHAWGWTELEGAGDVQRRVFPTRVGMDRPDQTVDWRRHRIPHTRGDGP